MTRPSLPKIVTYSWQEFLIDVNFLVITVITVITQTTVNQHFIGTTNAGIVSEMAEKQFDISSIAGKRVLDLTAEEFALLIYEASTRAYYNVLHETSGNKPQEKNIVRGIKSLSAALNCSETKIKTMIRSGKIHEPAMLRNGRVIWFDLDEVVAMIGDDPKSRWIVSNANLGLNKNQ